MPFLLLYVTHPSKPEAVQLSAKLLNERLIACMNYFPIESMYHWDSRLVNNQEIVTIYKTIPENLEAVQSMIEKNHKYTTPCIIQLSTVNANESYEQWIRSECTLTPKL